MAGSGSIGGSCVAGGPGAAGGAVAAVAGYGSIGGPVGSRAGKLVLDSFSYDFRPGSRTAIVGPTGVGKSTMIRLMLALLAPQKGTVTIYSDDATQSLDAGASGSCDADAGADAGVGRSVAENVGGSGNLGVANDAGGYVGLAASPSSRCNLVYVPQGNTLFSGTVRENLLMGNPDASEDQLRSVLHTAAADFVFGLPHGMDTQCFESGAGLSEGQAQRIAIARALLRPGSILLLDEFSSALDAATESVLLERLTSELPDHTMIFITHRDRIIDFCDSVLRLG